MKQTKQNGAWWSYRWISLVSDLALVAADEPVKPSASSGWRVTQLDVESGVIRARVKNRSNESVQIDIKLAPFTDSQWDEVLEALSSQALISVQLLAGEVPSELEDLFAQSGISLLPATAVEIQHHYQHSQIENFMADVDPHALLSVYLTFGEMLIDDPGLLLQLRGRGQHEIINALHEGRSSSNKTTHSPLVEASSSTEELKEPSTAEEYATPLESQIDQFWGKSRLINSFQHQIIPSPIDLILLKRLGPPPVAEDSMELYEQLAHIYRHVSEKMLALAYATDTTAEAENAAKANHENQAEAPKPPA